MAIGRHAPLAGADIRPLDIDLAAYFDRVNGIV
jgi:hypothetical protein